MASTENFNDHCWRDVIPQADLELYSGWRRETFVSTRPALLAIDLYDLVYRGGPHSPYELNARYPNSCGIYAHRARPSDSSPPRGAPAFRSFTRPRTSVRITGRPARSRRAAKPSFPPMATASITSSVRNLPTS